MGKGLEADHYFTTNMFHLKYSNDKIRNITNFNNLNFFRNTIQFQSSFYTLHLFTYTLIQHNLQKKLMTLIKYIL